MVYVNWIIGILLEVKEVIYYNIIIILDIGFEIFIIFLLGGVGFNVWGIWFMFIILCSFLNNKFNYWDEFFFEGKVNIYWKYYL